MVKHIWKLIGAGLLIYSFIIGMTVPLKPGVYSVTPFQLKPGTRQTVTIQGYNTFYSKAENPIRVWLKLDDANALPASRVNIVSDMKLEADFNMPAYFPGESEAVSLTLLVDSDYDGAAALPDAISITDDHPQRNDLNPIWTSQPITTLSARDGKTYPYRAMLGETIRNTFYHVPYWFAMMLILLIGTVFSWMYLQTLNERYDHWSVAFTKVGILYGLLGLATGSVWAKYTWGDWWNFDIKQNMAAIAMLVYMALFVLRSSFDDEEKKARIGNVYNIFAFATLIPLLFVIPRLVDSLHPGSGGNPGFGVDDLDNTMRLVLYPAVIGWLLLGIWMSKLLMRMSALRDGVYFS